MSQENVEVVRAAFEAWNAGDMDAFGELLAPDVISRSPDGWPEPGPYVGREAVMREFEQVRETWDADPAEPISDFIDAADRVVVRFIWHGAGHGPEANLELTGVYTMRKGKIFGIEYFWDHVEALEAVGLPEKGLQENVEVVRRWFSVMSGSAEEIRAAIADYWDADADYYPVRKVPGAQPCHGLEEVARFFAQFEDAFSRSAWDVRSVIAVGDDRVLASTNLRTHGRGSGIDLEGDVHYCYWLRHGRFFRVEDHLTVKGALGALGLPGETLEAAGLSV